MNPDPPGHTQGVSTTQAHLFFGGHAYGPNAASALLVIGETIACIGSDQAAQAQAPTDCRRTPLNGGLLTPTFRDAFAADLPDPQAALTAGVDPDPEVSSHQPWHPTDPIEALIRPAKLSARSNEDLEQLWAALTKAGHQLGRARLRAAGHQLYLQTPAGDHPTFVADVHRWGITVAVQPNLHPQPLGQLSRAGVPIAFGAASPEGRYAPWQAIAAAVNHPDPDAQLSPRAAYLAHTRGCWRLTGRDGGVLRPGAQASLAQWSPVPLRTGSTDPRLAAWSTDPTALPPALPDLTQPAPACVATFVRGEQLFPHDSAATIVQQDPASAP